MGKKKKQLNNLLKKQGKYMGMNMTILKQNLLIGIQK